MTRVRQQRGRRRMNLKAPSLDHRENGRLVAEGIRGGAIPKLELGMTIKGSTVNIN